ncbi:monothiol glutaredoxin-S2-like [Cornus florida]|uniref:monothiol glutaredoxin-S2-like n=1 Tax=Cornus florida TaxID=4283 RepID=UPI0028A250B1|nr:monothiol glutaredoxin-S2-like [Cornus florida]
MEGLRTMVSARPLVIFRKSSCFMSHTMITFFTNFGADPAIHELDQIPRGPEIEQALSRYGHNMVPVVFIGHELAGGANEITSLHLEGSLVPWLIRAGVLHL